MPMGKRSSHGAVVRLAETAFAAKVERWSPPPTWGEDREQSYLHRVRPQSDGQRRLMEAIERCHVTIALGPAGTGKTYLAGSSRSRMSPWCDWTRATSSAIRWWLKC
jgi:phosphate starvation-inducible PhoH-like protein